MITMEFFKNLKVLQAEPKSEVILAPLGYKVDEDLIRAGISCSSQNAKIEYHRENFPGKRNIRVLSPGELERENCSLLLRNKAKGEMTKERLGETSQEFSLVFTASWPWRNEDAIIR